MRKPLLTAAVLFAASPLLPGQSSDWHYVSELAGTATVDSFGAAVAALDDVDGDGHADFAVGAPTAAFSPGNQTKGAVFVYSGASGRELWRVVGTFVDGRFGAAVAGIGDVDGDGIRDLLVGAPDAGVLNGVGAGQAHVYSGDDGVLLRTHVGVALKDRVGSSVAALGDVDLDGIEDYLVGAQGTDTGLLVDNGAVRVHSGATGAELYRIDGTTDFSHFGASVAGVGDLDGDGRPDWIGGAPEASVLGIGADTGYVRVVSGANGGQLYLLQGAVAQEHFGNAMAGIEDLDGDGVPDFLVGAPDASNAGISDRGTIFVYSGGNGALLRRLDGLFYGARQGAFVAAVEDRDGDGVQDIAGGAPGVGRCYIWSGASGTFVQGLAHPSSPGDFGVAGAEVGDIDGDGRTELVVGSSAASAGTQPGSAALFRNVDLPEGFHWTRRSANSRWYGLRTGLTYVQAAAAADAESDVELVTVHDLPEQEWLWETMLASDGIAYIGLSDALQEGNFVWRSGDITPWWANNGYFGVGGVPGYWYFQEPNNLNNEDYVTIGRPGLTQPDGTWNDVNGQTARDALYEWTAPLSIQFSYTGSCPGLVSATCTGLTPSGQAAVVYGFTGQTTGAAGPCGQLTVPVSFPTVLFVATADSGGSIQFNANLPANACGSYYAFVLDLSSCIYSNVLTL